MNFESILEALRDPQTRHAAVVHFPIALSVLAPMLAIVAALFARRAALLRWIACAAFVLLLLAALMGTRSGEDAEHELGALPAAAEEIVEEHEEMAEKVWMFALAATLFAAASAVPKPALSAGAAWLAVLTGLTGAAWVGQTAHHGGSLVYHWGVGVETPDPALEEDTRARPADPRVAFFRETIRPILDDRCVRCHNPAGKRRAGMLDQTSVERMIAGGSDGPALVPGRPEESLMIKAVRWEIEFLEMPPDDDQLPEEEIAALVRWIEEGAVGDDGSGEPEPRLNTDEVPED